MRCAISFISVLVLTVGVGITAYYIISISVPDLSWQCKDGTSIPLIFRCNGLNNCADASDENPMDCYNINHTVVAIDRLFICGNNKSNRKTINPIRFKDMGCNQSNTSISCKGVQMKKFPYADFDLNARTLTLDNVFNIENLTDQLYIPNNNSIDKVNLEHNQITRLGKGSICNWKEACWFTLTNNSIQEISKDTFCEMPKLTWLTIEQNKLTFEGFRFKNMDILEDLWLGNNQIEVVTDGMFRALRNLVSLKLKNNRIRYIEERAFRHNTKLIEIDLSENLLKKLPPLVFEGQKALEKLHLGENPFQVIPGKVFSQLDSLVSLYLEEIDYAVIDFDALNNITKLDYVQFKKFSYCRYLPKATRCFPLSDGTSSIKNLLAGFSIRFLVWIVAIFTIVGNSIVLTTRCFFGGRRGRILDVFINNLAGADLLMGVYLIIIAVKDIQYRDAFHDHAFSWSTSLLCSGIGIMAMISCEVSLLILTFMSVERYLVISDPFSYHRKLSLNLARLSMLIIWILVTALAIAPAIQWSGKYSFYGSSGLCFPVHLDEPFAIGWQYTAFVIVGLNSACLIIVTISYSKLFCVIRTTRISTPIETKDIEMAVRLFLMVFTDCLCWLPIILLKIFALIGNQIPNELITWAVIFVLPINSTINPYLYTLSMPENRIKLFRRIIPTSAIRESLNLISLQFRRQGAATATETEDSPATWETTNATNTCATANDKKLLPLGKPNHCLSHRESIASSPMEETN